MSVLLETSFGDVVVDLFTNRAPLAATNFIKLCKLKHYNNALFMQVQKGTQCLMQTTSLKWPLRVQQLFGTLQAAQIDIL